MNVRCFGRQITTTMAYGLALSATASGSAVSSCRKGAGSVAAQGLHLANCPEHQGWRGCGARSFTPDLHLDGCGLRAWRYRLSALQNLDEPAVG